MSRYQRDLGTNTFSSRVAALINHQQVHWPLLGEGVRSLSRTVTRKIPLGDFEVMAQFNPKRIKSTTARVDEESIQNRACFLCEEKLPPEEKAVAYGEDLVILCNPFPILDHHLSIVHRQHIEQAITGRFESLLELAEDLSRDFFVLYNGPRCGASAPDHLHFQACSRQGLPIEEHVQAIETHPHLWVHKQAIVHTEGMEVFALKKYHLNVLVYRGTDQEALRTWFYRTLERLAKLTGNQPEPLINLIVTADDQGWVVYLFPRAKHRPSCYYAKGSDRLMVSPAAIDLAGCLVVPLEEHFQKIGPELVRQVFSEVTLGETLFSHLVKELSEPSVH